jgi:hypothetical protein
MTGECDWDRAKAVPWRASNVAPILTTAAPHANETSRVAASPPNLVCGLRNQGVYRLDWGPNERPDRPTANVKRLSRPARSENSPSAAKDSYAAIKRRLLIPQGIVEEGLDDAQSLGVEEFGTSVAAA